MQGKRASLRILLVPLPGDADRVYSMVGGEWADKRLSGVCIVLCWETSGAGYGGVTAASTR